MRRGRLAISLAGVVMSLLLSGAPVLAAEPGAIPGVASMQEAREISAQRKVPIVVDFSTDW